MVFYIETNSYLSIEKNKKLSSAKLYVKADDIETAIKKASKYLSESNGSHLKINKVEYVEGIMII